jgi:hypothetical protein
MSEKSVRVFRPEVQPRRSEIVAWGLAFASLVGLLLLNLGGMIFFWAVVFVLFLFLAAVSISLGNWMDGRTIIKLSDDSVSFQNGIRNVALPWHSVTSVTTGPARWGEKIQVMGERSHFEFNTLGEVVFQQEVQGKVGFPDGKEIKEEIIQKCGLTSVVKKGDSYYYSRP